jgi:hypothetical protein
MAKTDTAQSDGPEVIDRRKFLTAAAATTAASIMPRTADAEPVRDSIPSSASASRVQAPKVCAATARRLLEIKRRNELRLAAQLPPLFRKSCAE